jgi:hypothetical protein
MQPQNPIQQPVSPPPLQPQPPQQAGTPTVQSPMPTPQAQPLAPIQNPIMSQQPPTPTHQSVINKTTIIGGLLIVGGIAASLISYAMAVHNGGGTYYIFWYAPLFGVLLMLRGLGIFPIRRKKP